MMYYLYILVLCLCFLCSLISFSRNYAPQLKLFSVLLGITVLAEIIAEFYIKHLNRSNHPVYNVYMLVEYGFYVSFFRLLLRNRYLRKAINISLVVLPLIWCITIRYIFGLSHWDSYFLLLGDTFTLILCFFYFYELFASDELKNFSTTPEFWIVAATFIYCCCEIPFTGMLNYLALHYEAVALFLKTAMQFLNILMYCIIGVAYLLPSFVRPKLIA